MLIDLLSSDNYVSFNVKLANILGLKESIYISELLNINAKAIQKNKLKNDNIIINREYICQRTTITETEQLSLEKNLIKIGIICKGEHPNEIFLDVSMLTTLLTSPDEKLVDTVKLMGKLNKTGANKMTKRDIIKENLKAQIVCTNAELKEAYEGWIDGVYANPKGFLSGRAVAIAQGVVDEFSNHNLDVALNIINIATVNGYRDMTWAINTYKSNYNPKFVTEAPRGLNTPQKRDLRVSEEVF